MDPYHSRMVKYNGTVGEIYIQIERVLVPSQWELSKFKVRGGLTEGDHRPLF